MSGFLNELAANDMLAKAGIPMIGGFVCIAMEEAVARAETLQYPIVMKILSGDIQHKTDMGCVIMNIQNAEEVKTAYHTILENAAKNAPNAAIDGVLVQEMAPAGLEVILGMKRDPQFGPVIMVGTGGIYVEVFNDISLRLLPISRVDAEEMISETKLAKIIGGARRTVYDREVLKDAILNLAKLVESNPQLEEIDINPFFLYEEGKGGKGVDALIRLA